MTLRTPSSAMIWVSRSSRFAPHKLTDEQKQNGWKHLETSFPYVTRIHCFWKTSSRKMRAGAINSIRNQNGNWWRGIHRLPRDQKRLLTAFFDNKSIIHKEFVPAGQTIYAAFYQAVLNRLLRILWVRPELYSTGKWMLLHDNVPTLSMESARWPSHRFFLNFVKLKLPCVLKKWQRHTNHYSETLEKTAIMCAKKYLKYMMRSRAVGGATCRCVRFQVRIAIE